jgi:hypothetical protein
LSSVERRKKSAGRKNGKISVRIVPAFSEKGVRPAVKKQERRGARLLSGDFEIRWTIEREIAYTVWRREVAEDAGEARMHRISACRALENASEVEEL